MSHPSVQACGKTDMGLLRTDNQDNLFVEPMLNLYVVADGMGGHKGGATASRRACEVILDVVRRNIAHREPRLLLTEACQAAGAEVHREANQNHELHGMGTTVVLALLPRPDLAYIAHVGDSRAYLLRDRQLRRLTNDHTVVAELVAQGKLTAEQAIGHPHASVLSRNLGGLPSTEVDVMEIGLCAGDRLLLCSDGLNGYATHDAIEKTMSASMNADKTTEQLIELAKRGGGGDNVSALVIDIGDPKSVSSAEQVAKNGNKEWWKRRRLFFDICERMGLATSPLAKGAPKNEALELLANGFCEAVYHDLTKNGGVHVWTFADSIVTQWLSEDGDYNVVQEVFDILRAGAISVLKDIEKTDPDFAVCMEISLMRSFIVCELVAGTNLGAKIKEFNETVVSEETLDLGTAQFVVSETAPFMDPSETQQTPESEVVLTFAFLQSKEYLQANDPDPSVKLKVMETCHKVAQSDEAQLLKNLAVELYGSVLLSDTDLSPRFQLIAECRAMHLQAIVDQVGTPKTADLALVNVARTYQDLCHCLAAVVIEAGKPVSQKLNDLLATTAQMRERLSANEQYLAKLERGLDTQED